jgi:GTP diphosphokinase / guanosine-3',5'-bis(diphosphate) 3'-diphosphatase
MTASVMDQQLYNRLNTIIRKVQGYHPGADVEMLERAFEFAMERHSGQIRKSGEPYMTHPLEVMDIIAELRLDVASLCAGLLHDTVEDTDATVEQLRELFGEDVAFLVDGVTKLSKMNFTTKEEAQAANFRKMLVAMSRDLRVLLVKLSDRLHNMRTLKHMSASGQERIARETMDIYAPLAHRLGISWIKTELEDLSFRYMFPEAYYEIAEKIASKKRERESFIREVIKLLEDMLKEHEIVGFEVQGRPKNFWSIYRKMRAQQVELEQVYDLLAFRVMLKERAACYEVLGLVHNLWKPIPGRFKDYIAIPKPNGYQSLHTSVIGPYQQLIEVQIRTENMHKIAEEGIAAHWLYKEGKAVPSKDDAKFAWLHHLMEEHQDNDDPREFMESAKIDLFHDEVYVFTPRGDVMGFPQGATCVDFAYAIHTEVGHHCSGSKINGQIVPLKHELQNGDIVEVITNPHQRPNKDWLKFVKTGRAQTKIRNAIRKEQRDRSLELGRELMDKELKRHGTTMRAMEKSGKLAHAAENSRFSTVDEMLVEVGYGKFPVDAVIDKLFPPEARQEPKKEVKESKLGQLWDRISGKKSSSGVLVDGIEDVMVSYARCCNPIPGDDIVGFVTRGRGLTIHGATCDRVASMEEERRIPVSWAAAPPPAATGKNQNNQKPARRPVNVRVYCTDKPGLLASISTAFTQSDVNITQAHCLTTEDQRAINTFEVLVTDLEQLKRAMRQIEKIKGVYRVERA